MSKRVIAMICCVAVILSTFSGCNKDNTSEPAPPPVSSVAQSTSSVESTTSNSNSIEKTEWTGTQFDNPIDQEKFNTLLSRVRSNLEAAGITIIGDSEVADEVEPPPSIVFDPNTGLGNSSESSAETSEDTTSSATSEGAPEEEAPFQLTEVELIKRVYEIFGLEMPVESEIPAGVGSDTSALGGADTTSGTETTSGEAEGTASEEEEPAEPTEEEIKQQELLDNLIKNVKQMYRAFRTFAEEDCFSGENGEAWADYILYATVKLSDVSTEQQETGTYVVVHPYTDFGVANKVSVTKEELELCDKELRSNMLIFGYSLNTKRWAHASLQNAIVSAAEGGDVDSFVKSIESLNAGIVDDYTLMPDIGGWLIAPDTPASSFKESFNEKAQEWGTDLSMDKIFMSATCMQIPRTLMSDADESIIFEGNSDSIYAEIDYRSNCEDYIVIKTLIGYMFQTNGDNFKNLNAYLAKNYSKIISKADELLATALEPKPEPEGEVEGETSEPAESTTSEPEEDKVVYPDVDQTTFYTFADEDGNSILFQEFVKWLKEDMTPTEYKELCSWINVDALSYADIKASLSNSSSNIGSYGFVNSYGVSGALLKNNVVNDYNWILSFPITSKMITEEQLRKIVLTYVVYVGAFTDETFTRSLDTALSGIVNRTAEDDYAFSATVSGKTESLNILQG